ncbi:TPA: Abi family protein [Streptococcus equi subsp. zooepidemicus]|uniref:Abi family protein n=1 Tax=Streptococcus equi TaxID=1336 RepID=UPI0019807523|nr:Abi family protein [Streptococcus equi]MCD3367224.1 Abi family protein [Streptococcus equi subsp. zooepidemicus]MCD3370259.1 Abi family protein [Streptococcus equi subsp. zooepidemicus]MCD3374941.1 Abi family protein [Streptococcus equi subsp. zooepidemicus]MCD3379967.1 Abi family protein [Streptococcus equi subsp. zooepidemicus]MCD3405729.1 Abi family protein [Streptococcus equi subsp. zooepidemicus]
MSDSIFELTNFKEYLPLEIDISDKDYLHYEPILAPTKLKKKVEPSLSEEELYDHMRDHSKWNFSKEGDTDFYKQDCIDFLRDTDFQSFSQYGKLTDRDYSKTKSVYLFDSYLRNFLQEILERIEIFLKKSTSDAITLGYHKELYIFEDDELYYNESKKYHKDNAKIKELVLKTKYHLSRLILEKKDDYIIQKQLSEYGVVLPWTVFRLMTFGNIASFLIALQPDYRNKVASYVSLPLSGDDKIPAKILLSWCNALRYLRNICSHNSRLYGRLHNTLPAIHHADKGLLLVDSENADSNNDDKKLFVFFVAMRHLAMSMSKESQFFWNSKLH